MRYRLSGQEGDKGRDHPEHDDREREGKPPRRQDRHENKDGDRDSRCRPHLPGNLRRRRVAPRDLIRRHPLEAAPAADEEPPQRPADRIGHQPRLMRQECRRQKGLACARDEGVALGSNVVTNAHAAHAAPQRACHLHVSRERKHQDGKHRPEERGARQDRPPGSQQAYERDRQQASSQVVQDLPASDGRKRVRNRAARRIWHRAPQPSHDLPVSTDPAMLSRGKCEVLRRVVIDQVDIGAQAGTRVNTFEQIVTEQRILRDAIVERGVEGIDIVNALADVTALVEQILIHVRDRRRVRIDSNVSGEDFRERRPVGADDVDADTRLQDAVTFRDTTQSLIEPWSVQRVRQRTDEPSAGFERKLGIGIQGDDVSNRMKKVDLTVADNEAGVRRAAQEPIEFGQLATLAFPAHPESFAGIPAALAVKIEKPLPAVSRIQLVDALPGPREDHVVSRT